jgi:hypothetical protein
VPHGYLKHQDTDNEFDLAKDRKQPLSLRIEARLFFDSTPKILSGFGIIHDGHFIFSNSGGGRRLVRPTTYSCIPIPQGTVEKGRQTRS